MTLSAHVLDRLPARLRQNGLISTAGQLEELGHFQNPEAAWGQPHDRFGERSGGFSDSPASSSADAFLQRVLLQGQWPAGRVSELSVCGALAGATSLALSACRHVQTATASEEPGWCAFIDPSGTLHAPGVARAGVLLSRLLILRPATEDVSRVLLRLALSQTVPLIVVDLVGGPTSRLEPRQREWNRVVRRLGPELAQTETRVLLLTDRASFAASPLPVALRIEVTRKEPRKLQVEVKKHVGGRLVPPRTLTWGPAVSRARTQSPSPSQTPLASSPLNHDHNLNQEDESHVA